MAKSNTEHKMIKSLKPLEFFKEFLNGRDESPYPVLVGLYFSDNYVSLAKGDKSYLGAHYCGLYLIGNLDDLVEKLQSLEKLVGFKLRGIIVSSNNSVRLDLSGITFPIRRQPLDRKRWCPKAGDFEAYSAVRMLQVSLDFLNTLVDRKNFRVGEEDS